MDNPLQSKLLRLLLLFLQLSAAVLAVPSSTDPQKHVTRPFALSLPPVPPPHFSLWSSLRSFLSDFYRDFKRQHPSEPVSLDPGSLDRLHVAPSQQLLGRYGDQLVLRFNLSTEDQALKLQEAANTLFLDVWGQSDGWVDIRLAKDVVPALLGLLPDSLQRAHIPLMQGRDLARAVAETYPAASLSPSGSFSKRRRGAFASAKRKSPDPDDDSHLFFDDYRPLPFIEHWMSLLQSIFSTHVQVISIGTTFEGRDIPALRVGVHPTNPEQPMRKRDTVVVSGGQHAREWISTSTVSYIAHSLVTSYGKDASVTDLLESLDFVFIPTLNPDGYQYSWDFDRLWRKNRQTTSLRFCKGIDLDRSWSFKWDGERTRNNPCSESFAGADPFEAVESSQFAQWAKNESENNNVQFVGFLDLHSYSQQILYPYAYTCNSDPPTLEDLQELGQGLAKSIRFSSREHYKVVSACEGNVAASGKVLPRFEGGGGSALDWFYHELNVRKSFQIKLRDKGAYGFLLPKEYIIPTGLEILSLVQYLGKTLQDSAVNQEYAAARETPQTVISTPEQERLHKR